MLHNIVTIDILLLSNPNDNTNDDEEEDVVTEQEQPVQQEQERIYNDSATTLLCCRHPLIHELEYETPPVEEWNHNLQLLTSITRQKQNAISKKRIKTVKLYTSLMLFIVFGIANIITFKFQTIAMYNYPNFLNIVNSLFYIPISLLLLYILPYFVPDKTKKNGCPPNGTNNEINTTTVHHNHSTTTTTTTTNNNNREAEEDARRYDHSNGNDNSNSSPLSLLPFEYENTILQGESKEENDQLLPQQDEHEGLLSSLIQTTTTTTKTTTTTVTERALTFFYYWWNRLCLFPAPTLLKTVAMIGFLDALTSAMQIYSTIYIPLPLLVILPQIVSLIPSNFIIDTTNSENVSSSSSSSLSLRQEIGTTPIGLLSRRRTLELGSRKSNNNEYMNDNHDTSTMTMLSTPLLFQGHQEEEGEEESARQRQKLRPQKRHCENIQIIGFLFILMGVIRIGYHLPATLNVIHHHPNNSKDPFLKSSTNHSQQQQHYDYYSCQAVTEQIISTTITSSNNDCSVCQVEITKEGCLSHYHNSNTSQGEQDYYNISSYDEFGTIWEDGNNATEDDKNAIPKNETITFDSSNNSSSSSHIQLRPFCKWLPIHENKRIYQEKKIVSTWFIILLLSCIPITLSAIYKQRNIALLSLNKCSTTASSLSYPNDNTHENINNGDRNETTTINNNNINYTTNNSAMDVTTTASVDQNTILLFNFVYTSVFRVFFSFLLAFPFSKLSSCFSSSASSTSFLAVVQNIWNGFCCYFLKRSFINSGCHPDSICSSSSYYVNAYIVCNIGYMLSLLSVLKYGGTILHIYIAFILMIPLGRITYTILPYFISSSSILDDYDNNILTIGATRAVEVLVTATTPSTLAPTTEAPTTATNVSTISDSSSLDIVNSSTSSLYNLIPMFVIVSGLVLFHYSNIMKHKNSEETSSACQDDVDGAFGNPLDRNFIEESNILSSNNYHRRNNNRHHHHHHQHHNMDSNNNTVGDTFYNHRNSGKSTTIVAHHRHNPSLTASHQPLLLGYADI